ncbi:hypothetical protein ADU59_09195 [Pararhizobium polonicum]|uniref:Uncharacterized protein n=1 Tax=Pararhizobium polonicum TaxID=1612624 RepID=A0A1C7P781_9HYPH|nr:hypothetical protein [Pararhizobium polonicum]OBZ95564.1 hypothetical protein ADU59_09195 [Pararhizobium polonicum]
MTIFRYFDWAAILVFAIAGPLVVEVAFFFWLIVVGPIDLLYIANLGGTRVDFFSILPFFYLLCFVPALFAGVLFGIAWRMWPKRMQRGMLICTIAGGGAGMFAALSWATLFGFPDYSSAFLYFGLPTCSGALCARFVRRIKIVTQKPLATDAP